MPLTIHVPSFEVVLDNKERSMVAVVDSTRPVLDAVRDAADRVTVCVAVPSSMALVVKRPVTLPMVTVHVHDLEFAHVPETLRLLTRSEAVTVFEE